MLWCGHCSFLKGKENRVIDTYDPLAHVPDPNDPIQVFAYRRGAEIYVEIRAKDAKDGLTVPWLDALKVASAP